MIFQEIILQDWDYLTHNLSVTSSPSYIFHNDKPVLFVWGMGFTDREATADDSLVLINALKVSSYFVGGVPTNWRTGDGDSLPGFEEAYGKIFVICLLHVLQVYFYLQLLWILSHHGWSGDSPPPRSLMH